MCEPSANGLAEAIITLIEKTHLREALTKNALRLKLSSWEEIFDAAFEETFKALNSDFHPMQLPKKLEE
jgi:hypothetical protein